MSATVTKELSRINKLKTLVTQSLDAIKQATVDAYKNSDEKKCDQAEELAEAARKCAAMLIKLTNASEAMNTAARSHGDVMLTYTEELARLNQDLFEATECSAALQDYQKAVNEARGTVEDEDIVMDSQAPLQELCPITKCEFVDPVKNANCNHSYSKEAILQLIRQSSQHRRGPAKCPVAGCNQPLDAKHLIPNPELMRELKRLKARRQAEAPDSEDSHTIRI